MESEGIALGEKQDKRERLLQAAQKEFFENGYHNVTSEEIARQAGVGKGTLYAYFESKQALFSEVLRFNVQQYYDRLVVLIDENHSFTENLRSLVHYHLEHLQEMDLYFTRFMADAPGHSEHVLAKNAKQYVGKLLGGMVEAGIRSGELREINVELAPGYLVGIFLGLLHAFNLEEMTEAEKANLEDDVLDLMLHGMAAR